MIQFTPQMTQLIEHLNVSWIVQACFLFGVGAVFGHRRSVPRDASCGIPLRIRVSVYYFFASRRDDILENIGGSCDAIPLVFFDNNRDE